MADRAYLAGMGALALALVATAAAAQQTPSSVRRYHTDRATPPPDDRTALLRSERKRLEDLLDKGWRPESDRVRRIKERIAALEAEAAARRPAPPRPAAPKAPKPSPPPRKRG